MTIHNKICHVSMSEQPLAGYHPDMNPIISRQSITSGIMIWFGIENTFFLVQLKSVVWSFDSSTYSLVWDKAGWAGSQLCKSSFSYSTRADLRSISGWGTWAPEDHPITQLMMIRPVKFYDTFALDTGVLREIYPTRLLCRESPLATHTVPPYLHVTIMIGQTL